MNSNNDEVYNELTRREIYDHTFGIHKVSQDNPLSSIAISPVEDYVTGGMYEKEVDEYISLGVWKHLGISLDDYLDRPPYVINQIKRALSKVNKTINKIQTTEENKLANSVKNLQKQLNK